MKTPRFLKAPFDAGTAVRTVLALAILGALAGGSVVALGLYNVSARTGHWPGISWLLHSTFRNSVALRAHGEPPEDLLSPGMIALGAGHYDSACTHCHASPGTTRSATIRAAEPEPPHLTDAVRDWEPDEFHWIVHNGVIMSGMPAWPAERDDDVWPVVAFLIAARGMSAEEYAALTEKPDGNSCQMCHGENGVSENRHVPRLDILSETYIAASLEAYRNMERDSGIMAEAMDGIPEEAIPRIARRFASVEPDGSASAGGELSRRGRELATARGTADVPACRACHGPWPDPLNPAFPSLAGQHAPYLEAQLKLWRDGNRGGGRASELMHHAARDLTDDDIAALASYYAGMAPAKLDHARE